MWAGKSFLDQVKEVFSNSGGNTSPNSPVGRNIGQGEVRGTNPNRPHTPAATTPTTATQPSGSAQGYQQVQNVSVIPEPTRKGTGLPIPMSLPQQMLEAGKLIGSGGYDFSTGSAGSSNKAYNDASEIPDAGIPSIPSSSYSGSPGYTTTVSRNVPPPPKLKTTETPTFDRYERPEWRSEDPADVAPITDPPQAYKRDKEKYTKLIGR